MNDLIVVAPSYDIAVEHLRRKGVNPRERYVSNGRSHRVVIISTGPDFDSGTLRGRVFQAGDVEYVDGWSEGAYAEHVANLLTIGLRTA